MKTQNNTPWRVESDANYDRVYGYTDQGSFCIATCNDSNDAHLIVRAVNSHELLLSALRGIINSCPATKEYDDIVAIAEKAIAKAEGKE